MYQVVVTVSSPDHLPQSDTLYITVKTVNSMETAGGTSPILKPKLFQVSGLMNSAIFYDEVLSSMKICLEEGASISCPKYEHEYTRIPTPGHII